MPYVKDLRVGIFRFGLLFFLSFFFLRDEFSGEFLFVFSSAGDDGLRGEVDVG